MISRTIPRTSSAISATFLGVNATPTMLRISVCRGASDTMNDSIDSNCGKSSTNTPSAELNTSVLYSATPSG
jgi:hypothetical protein